MEKPEHLGPAPLHARAASWVALGLGVVTIIAVLATQRRIWEQPDPRVSVPGLVATSLACGVALIRRERSWKLWVAGLSLALVGLAFGAVLQIGIVIAAMVVLIGILHAVM
ncbi:MAG TPA: hypothetical protein VGM88_33315 [Kofleriaceae bacterium]|jgi:hypothetical protein